MKKSIIAITGPSGAGKTTLGYNLSNRYEISIPRHCTTRQARSDDMEGFYRYLTHDQYSQMFDNGDFLITSGDGPEIKKEYGNFYGVSCDDCAESWKRSEVIILFVSYKDIDQLLELRNRGIDVDIVNLTFDDLRNGMYTRIKKDGRRNQTDEEIKRRISIAEVDREKYGEAIRLYSKSIVFTDLMDIESTYKKVCDDLELRK